MDAVLAGKELLMEPDYQKLALLFPNIAAQLRGADRKMEANHELSQDRRRSLRQPEPV